MGPTTAEMLAVIASLSRVLQVDDDLQRSSRLAGRISRGDSGREGCLHQDHLARRGAGDPVQGEMTMTRKCPNCEARKGMTRFESETFTIEHAGMTARVDGLSGWRCGACG